MVDLNVLISTARDLTPLSESSLRLTNMLGGDDWTLQDIVSIVRLDPPLTGRVLGLVNSAAMGTRTPITDIEQAVVRLGPGTIMMLALGGSARQTLTQALPVYDLTEGALWRHSVATALAVEQAHVLGYCKASPGAFATALLHDIGKLVLGRYLRSEEMEYVHRSCVGGGHDFIGAEMEILGVHHGEVGALVAEHWQLPALIVAGIRHHHSATDSPDEIVQRSCDLITLGNYVARQVGCGDAEPLGDAPDPAVMERLTIDVHGVQAICDSVTERLAEVLSNYEN